MFVLPFFLNTVDELRNRSRSFNPYERIRGGALLRQLLLDGNALVHQVNRDYKLRLAFRANVDQAVGPSGLVPVFWMHGDGLDPDSVPPGTYGEPAVLSLSDFLAFKVTWIRGEYYSVRDVIDRVANVEGGVHLGTPRSEADKRFDQALGSIPVQFGGMSATAQQIAAIGRVTCRGLEPLEAKVRETLKAHVRKR